MKTLLKLLCHQDGNALIETALILPVFVLLLLGATDFAVLLNEDLRLADTARSAAEAATVRTFATNLQLMQIMGNTSTPSIPNFSVTAANYCTCANGTTQVSCSSHANCGSYGIPNQYMKVTVSGTLPLIFGIQGLPLNINVQSVAIARTAWTGTN